jgi:DHA1 family tetracycline resistance protein-like MFS transporter
MTQRSRGKLLAVIFLTVFIDMLGVSIVIPVIPALFFTPDTQFFSSETPEATISVLYGLLLACYPIMQFFGAPLLGALSDKHGRKPVLSVSLIGTFIGYVLFATAIVTQNLWLLFFSRMLPGFTGGNISIIMSSIADVSKVEDKAKNFGLVGMAFGLGFIFGPTIGGILSDDSIVSWFNHSIPFMVTAVLTAINFILVRLNFPETNFNRKTTPFSLFAGFQNIAKSFSTPNLRTIFGVVLIMSLGFTFYTQFFSVFLIQKFEYAEKDIGILYGWVGLWLAFTQGVIVRRLALWVKSHKVLFYSMPFIAIGLAMLLIPSKAYLFFFINPIIAVAQGITAPNLTAVVSSEASASDQGQILGINQSMQSLGQSLPPLIAGYIAYVNVSLPIVIAASLSILGWLGYMIFRRNRG